MKTKLILSVMLAALSAVGGIYYNNPLANGGLIPDNNPNGYVNTISVSGAGSSLQSLTLTLNLSSGYNGDLYAYLTFNGTTVTLLNRVGTGGGNTYGYSDTGFNMTFSDSGTAGLHNYQANGGTVNGSGQLTGTWQPDSGGVTFASAYNGQNPNGTWAIFFADLSAGDQSTLVSWSLDITAVPEPVDVALIIFGAMLTSVAAGRWCWQRRMQKPVGVAWTISSYEQP